MKRSRIDLQAKVWVLKEFAQDVEVMFIDYENFLTVDRSEIFRPAKGWNQKPFGHFFQFDANFRTISHDNLNSVLVNKSVELHTLKQDDDIAICVFTQDPKNQPIVPMVAQLQCKQNPKGSVFDRLGSSGERQAEMEIMLNFT